MRKPAALLACILSAGCGALPGDMTFHFVGLNGTWEYTPVVTEQECAWHMPSGVLTISGERDSAAMTFSWSSLDVTYRGAYSSTHWDDNVLLARFQATPREMPFTEHGSSSAVVEGDMEDKNRLAGAVEVVARGGCTYKATWTARRLSGP